MRRVTGALRRAIKRVLRALLPGRAFTFVRQQVRAVRAAGRLYKRMGFPKQPSDKVDPTDESWRRTRLPVPVGPQLGLAPHRRVPVAMVLLLDVACEEVEPVVDAIARQQLEGSGFAPLFVTCCDDLRPFRRHGFRVEHVMSPEDWDLIAAEEPWADDWLGYVEHRLRRLWNLYRPEDIVPVLSADPSAWRVGGTLGLAEPLLPPRIPPGAGGRPVRPQEPTAQTG